MSSPLVEPDDLGTYLDDPTINEDRAVFLIAQAQALCESIITPLPAAAAVVVTRVAARAYVSTSTMVRGAQYAAAGSPFAASGGMGGSGGVYLTRFDKADLRRLNGGGGAFSISTLPAGYAAVVPWWDANLEPGFDDTTDPGWLT